MKYPLLKIMMVICCILILSQTALAYDIPQRKIDVKPYVTFYFPNNLWEARSLPGTIDNKLAPGFGIKTRMQCDGAYGLVFNFAYYNFKTVADQSNNGALFTGGGYYATPLAGGTLTFDAGYGILTAVDEAVELLMPSVEYARPVSERASIAFELGWPIANDWLADFEFKENYSSFTLSFGATILF